MAQQQHFTDALSLIEQVITADSENEPAQALKVKIGLHCKNFELSFHLQFRH
mgnify:CR=1 FL=1